MVWLTLLLFLLSCAGLIAAGTLLVGALSRIAAFLRMKEFVVSFIIMAFSTSVPELMVGIMSALQQTNAIVLGTVIGSNLADVTLVAGIATILGRGIRVRHSAISQDIMWMFVLGLLPLLLMVIGQRISRLDGILLVCVYCIYLYVLCCRYPGTRRMKNHVGRWRSIGYTLLFLASLYALFKAADFVVFYGAELASELELPSILIGLFFVAVGTSLPELAFEVRAVQKRRGAMALGDLLGSVVANSTLVLGISAIIHPITAHYNLFLISAGFMVFGLFIFATMLESGGGLSVREGIALVMFYILFIVVELTLKGILV